MEDKLSDLESMIRLDGKYAVITGAASGIGRAQARLFSMAGASVFALDLNEDGLIETAAGHSRITVIQSDLASEVGIEMAVKRILSLAPQIDVLCNTAGVLDNYTPSLKTDEAMWDHVFDVNVKAIYRMTNAFLPAMIEAGGGVILNMSSIASIKAGGGGAAYTASKHAVVGYTRQLSNDYGRFGIRTNAICPGMIATGMTKSALENPKMVAAVKKVPAGRIGTPEDVAHVSLFLAGPGASFIHGASIFVDGGLTVR